MDKNETVQSMLACWGAGTTVCYRVLLRGLGTSREAFSQYALNNALLQGQDHVSQNTISLDFRRFSARVELGPRWLWRISTLHTLHSPAAARTAQASAGRAGRVQRKGRGRRLLRRVPRPKAQRKLQEAPGSRRLGLFPRRASTRAPRLLTGDAKMKPQELGRLACDARSTFGSTLHLASVAVLLGFGAGCTVEDDLPGDSLGTFAVTAVLSVNTCGSQLEAENPWKFEAEMSLSDNTLYFRAEDEDYVSAALDSDNAATFTTVDNSQTATDSSCSISLKRNSTVELDSTTAPETSSGSFHFKYSAVEDDTCASQLSENGGVYDELPCEVEYQYTALRE